MTELPIKIPFGKWYVYHHYADGTLFYIGMGAGLRAMSLSGRTEKWTKIFKESKESWCEIVSFFETGDEAFDHEQQQIREFQPIANIIGTENKPAGRTKYKKVNTNLSEETPFWKLKNKRAWQAKSVTF